jgi:hypothetical protein
MVTIRRDNKFEVLGFANYDRGQDLILVLRNGIHDLRVEEFPLAGNNNHPQNPKYYFSRN